MANFDFSRLQPAKHGGLKGKIAFPKFNRDVDLVVESDTVANMTQAQRRSIVQFIDWNDDLFSNLEAPIFRYYRHFMEMVDLDEPQIDSCHGVWPHIQPAVVIIPDYQNGENTYVQIEFNCDWEIEHGMEWDIRNGRDIYYVGPFEGNSFEWLEKDGPSGYALTES